MQDLDIYNKCMVLKLTCNGLQLLENIMIKNTKIWSMIMIRIMITIYIAQI